MLKTSEDYAAEPNFRQIVHDFQHFLNIRGDNHRYMEHLFMDRLKVESELLEKLETEIEHLKMMTLKSCPNCGMRRPKRYHRSTQTPKTRSVSTIIDRSRNLNFSSEDEKSLPSPDIEGRLKRLTEKVDKVSTKTNGMLHRSYRLQNSSKSLRNQVDRMQVKYEA